MLGSGRGTALRRVALPLQHGVFTAGACWVLLSLSLLCVGLCHQGAEGDRPGLKEGGKCIERERKSLLAVRADIWYPRNHWPFSSWEKINGDDCCLWEGVRCDNQSGHVIKLDLRRPQSSYYDDDYYYDEVSPSLLNLTWLRYLDLSNNYFRGAPIPNFIGSLVNLEYLNLSHAGFGGTLPPQLGGLHLLHSLDLSGNYMLKVENLHWLSHLSQLQYLDMSRVLLFAVTNWLHVINGLPSLSVVRLSGCDLQTLPTTLPHVNFTSLSTLDLSRNFFRNSTWPLWLFNITTLAELDLRYNDGLRGPIPDEFEKMKHLEVLKLTGGFGIDGGVTPPSLLTLNKLKKLRLYGIRLPEHMEKLSNLRTLALIDIIGQIPESLGNLSHLESLFIYGGDNTSRELPESLGNLVNLKRLALFVSDSQGISHIPESLGNLSRLESLSIGGYIHSTTGLLESMGNLGNLQTLELFLDNFHGRIPESLGNLSRLESLSISGYINSTTGLPESLRNLGNLKTLELSLYNFHGAIPESLGNLSRLESLSISSGYIITVPESLGNLVNLKDLRLYSYDTISRGGIPESLGNLRGLKTLHVYGFNITQEVLRNMGHLCNLTRLEVSGNMELGAEVNELFEGLSQCTKGSSLEHLALGDNGFGGHLPDQVGQLSNLNYLVLGGNSIVGSIPASIGELKSLTHLILSDNNLTGLVPSSIGKLSNLMSLDISSNRFDGVLSEAHFANLSMLKVFDMSYNPALSLSIDWAWLPPFQLDTFQARLCKIGPAFPKWLQTQKKLRELDISNNDIFDTLGSNFFNSFGRMVSLNLSHNGIKGNLPFPLPSPFFLHIDLRYNHFEASGLHLYSGSDLRHLDLSHNHISGPISVSTGDFELTYLDLSHNNINGTIPLSICQIQSLQVLDLSSNYLSGKIPGCWKSARLIALKLSHNKLQGTIPNSLGTLSQLMSLHLDKNNLTGVVPPSLKYLSGLVMLDLGENQLSGAIPTWLGQSLSSLEVLRLRSNKFYGDIPRSLSQLQSLRVLDLACNTLSGNLLLSFNNFSAMATVEKSSKSVSQSFIIANAPSSIEESIRMVPKGTELEYTTVLRFVTIIDLSDNSLSGYIPEDITSLCGLRFLNLSWNNLNGSIPTDVSGMQLLESLDLSSNQLFGNIPSSISTMLFLNHFNVSYNNLFGRIPSGPQLQTFDQSTYIGNPSLCGPPLLRLCPDDPTSQDPISQPSKGHEDKHEPYVIWLYIGMGTGFAAGFWGFLGGLLLMEKKRRMYFRSIDYVADELYVLVVVHFARLKLKISSWMFK